mmetsp:Transcript_20700/g.61199  ORF Transcript_20700/g.61199 Transcript_20700/m.61199 type:complete len:374 (-) Transcript_20700:649-1770(-)
MAHAPSEREGCGAGVPAIAAPAAAKVGRRRVLHGVHRGAHVAGRPRAQSGAEGRESGLRVHLDPVHARVGEVGVQAVVEGGHGVGLERAHAVEGGGVPGHGGLHHEQVHGRVGEAPLGLEGRHVLRHGGHAAPVAPDRVPARDAAHPARLEVVDERPQGLAAALKLGVGLEVHQALGEVRLLVEELDEVLAQRALAQPPPKTRRPRVEGRGLHHVPVELREEARRHLGQGVVRFVVLGRIRGLLEGAGEAVLLPLVHALPAVVDDEKGRGRAALLEGAHALAHAVRVHGGVDGVPGTPAKEVEAFGHGLVLAQPEGTVHGVGRGRKGTVDRIVRAARPRGQHCARTHAAGPHVAVPRVRAQDDIVRELVARKS